MVQSDPHSRDAVSSYRNGLWQPPPGRDVRKIGDQSIWILAESQSRSDGFREFNIDGDFVAIGRDPHVADLVAVRAAARGVERNMLSERNTP
ncbi:MAG TPA: hypothetical protein VNS62_04075 [Candidatus Udaeobacter sp.]|nr:hypothetical protein [Candidatus Udaeobacter sp.]